ncbi:hypothetical protein [Thioclava sp. GXIMD2076]|uniref:hypothetical protein n=1 Tax=unclassified Thioclava TaxID=2621713 RepID=UPI0030D3FDBC
MDGDLSKLVELNRKPMHLSGMLLGLRALEEAYGSLEQHMLRDDGAAITQALTHGARLARNNRAEADRSLIDCLSELRSCLDYYGRYVQGRVSIDRLPRYMPGSEAAEFLDPLLVKAAPILVMTDFQGIRMQVTAPDGKVIFLFYKAIQAVHADLFHVHRNLADASRLTRPQKGVLVAPAFDDKLLEQAHLIPHLVLRSSRPGETLCRSMSVAI